MEKITTILVIPTYDCYFLLAFPGTYFCPLFSSYEVQLISINIDKPSILKGGFFLGFFPTMMTFPARITLKLPAFCLSPLDIDVICIGIDRHGNTGTDLALT